MANIKDGYCKVGFKDIRELKPIPAIVLSTIALLLRDPKNTNGEIANKTMCDLIGISKHTLLEAVDKLVIAGLITRTQGNGSGNKSIYEIAEKGAKNEPFEEKKGAEIAPKRVQKLHEKGAEIAPINKEINNNKREETPTPKKEVMENFNLFCELYPVDPEWAHEKEACERVWWAMDREWKEKIIEQLKNNQRWRLRDHDNPYWYLKDYAGRDARVDLPFVKNGSAQISRWIKDGKPVCVMLYQEGDWSGCIYCLESDRGIMEKAGARYVRNM